MRWLRRRKTDPPAAPASATAHKALRKAEADLKQAQERNSEIASAVHVSKQYLESNNFTELIRRSLHRMES